MRVNPKKLARAAVVFFILTAAVSVFAAYGVLKLSGREIVKKADLKASQKKLDSFEKIISIQDKIKKEYLFDFDEAAGYDDMAKALAAGLGDSYSEYMTAEEVKQWEDAVNSGFTGIGITCSAEDGRAEVLSVAEDGPADAADIEPGDVIKTVDGKSYDNEKDFLKAISGKPGTTLKLGVIRGWYEFTADVTIAEVKMRAVSGKVIKKDVGYIRITSFSENSADEFAAELKALNEKHVKYLIIDLRNNGGGYVDQGIKICDMILPECTIGYLQNKAGKKTAYNSDEESLDLPVAVLVNERSASASEITASAIRDNKAGIIVGTVTYGKGLSQKEFTFDDGSALKLTTAKYLTPLGKAIDGTGVKPDTIVEESKEGDEQLDKAVSLLKKE